jgi:hypothetical protein
MNHPVWSATTTNWVVVPWSWPLVELPRLSQCIFFSKKEGSPLALHQLMHISFIKNSGKPDKSSQTKRKKRKQA